MSQFGWEIVIGLEIHVQLSTKAKIFSSASTQFGAAPNAQASAVDLGLPGVLPIVNEAVYRKAVALGLGIGANINLKSSFDRKNYFYPDLPKGYQITQLHHPIIEQGRVDIMLADHGKKTIRITRAHLEEDAGKSLHDMYHHETGIDLNRAGIPLLEIVSEPDLRSAAEAVAYAKKIHQLVVYLDVSDGKMSEGSLRCDANVSLRPKGSSELGVRTETKNINSFKFLERAINYEIERQKIVLESGGKIIQETRLYDPDKDETRPMRNKETSTDYRYFPEPDLLPVEIDAAYVEDIRANMPELPEIKVGRFISDYQIPVEDAMLIAVDKRLANYFEAVVHDCDDPQLAANWVRVAVLGHLNKAGKEIDDLPIPAQQLGLLITKINDKSISGKIAKTIFEALWQKETDDVEGYIEHHRLTQVSDPSELAPLIDTIVAKHPKQVQQYQSGKAKLMGFFVGQVMQATQGKANPQQVNQLLQSKLNH